MKKLTASIIFFYVAVSLFSIDIDAVKSLDDTEFPLTHNIVLKNGDVPELTLLPEVSGAERIRQHFSELQPEVTVEKLFRLSLEADESFSVNDVFLKLANIFGNPKTQMKYLYRSSRAKKIVPLIDEAYICNYQGTKMPPLTFSMSDIPGTFQYFQYVDEFSFTGMVMKISLDITEECLYVTLTNAESLNYWIIPLIPKESMYTDNFIFFIDNSLYLYSIAQLLRDVPFKKVGPYTIRPAGMIGKRMDVMTNWIKGELALAQ
jgi:hypothetical protein